MSRILSIDYGERRIGIALSDPLKIIAIPYTTIDRLVEKDFILSINRIIKDNEVIKIIFGLPFTLKNSQSKQTENVLKFVENLKKKISFSIETYDERLTSKLAKQSLIFQGVKTGHNKKDIDKTAAAIFLQNYLDEQNS